MQAVFYLHGPIQITRSDLYNNIHPEADIVPSSIVRVHARVSAVSVQQRRNV